jgi:hypothetical protein
MLGQRLRDYVIRWGSAVPAQRQENCVAGAWVGQSQSLQVALREEEQQLARENQLDVNAGVLGNQPLSVA